MNLITRINKEYCVLPQLAAPPIKSLGSEVTLFVRTQLRDFSYLVEIEDTMEFAKLFPRGLNSCHLFANMLSGDGLGAKHKFGVYGSSLGFNLSTIDGFLWDDRLLHVKDIVI